MQLPDVLMLAITAALCMAYGASGVAFVVRRHTMPMRLKAPTLTLLAGSGAAMLALGMSVPVLVPGATASSAACAAAPVGFVLGTHLLFVSLAARLLRIYRRFHKQRFRVTYQIAHYPSGWMQQARTFVQHEPSYCQEAPEVKCVIASVFLLACPVAVVASILHTQACNPFLLVRIALGVHTALALALGALSRWLGLLGSVTHGYSLRDETFQFLVFWLTALAFCAMLMTAPLPQAWCQLLLYVMSWYWIVVDPLRQGQRLRRLALELKAMQGMVGVPTTMNPTDEQVREMGSSTPEMLASAADTSDATYQSLTKRLEEVSEQSGRQVALRPDRVASLLWHSFNALTPAGMKYSDVLIDELGDEYFTKFMMLELSPESALFLSDVNAYTRAVKNGKIRLNDEDIDDMDEDPESLAQKPPRQFQRPWFVSKPRNTKRSKIQPRSGTASSTPPDHALQTVDDIAKAEDAAEQANKNDSDSDGDDASTPLGRSGRRYKPAEPVMREDGLDVVPTAAEIAARYLVPNAKLQVNAYESSLRAAVKLIRDGEKDPAVFKTVRSDIRNIVLLGPWVRFVQADMFSRYLQDSSLIYSYDPKSGEVLRVPSRAIDLNQDAQRIASYSVARPRIISPRERCKASQVRTCSALNPNASAPSNSLP